MPVQGEEDHLIIENGQFTGFMYIAFYDENKLTKNPTPFSIIEFPLSYFEPLKPIHMQFKLPMNKTEFDNYIDFELDFKDPKIRQSDQELEMRERKKRHTVDFHPIVFLTLQLQTKPKLFIQNQMAFNQIKKKSNPTQQNVFSQLKFASQGIEEFINQQGVNEFEEVQQDTQEYCKISISQVDIEPSMSSSLFIGDAYQFALVVEKVKDNNPNFIKDFIEQSFKTK